VSALPAMTLVPAVAAARHAAVRMRHPLVLVDGPSGAGKTTFATALIAAWPGSEPRLVRVDETIPGWPGLHRGAARLGRSLLAAHARGGTGSVHRWDWPADRPGSLERMSPGRPLIVEGCGAFLAGERHSDAVRVWLDAPYAVRRRRALERDRGAFDPHWEAWEADWRRHLLRARPDRRPALTVRLAD
jgi:hypothetical protein